MLYNARTYAQDRVQPDSVRYAGPANTFAIADTVDLRRVYPKPVNGFAGVAKPSLKRVKTVVTNATTGETHDMIFTLSASVPVGTAAADVEAELADLVSWLATADAKSLFKTNDIFA